MLNNTYLKAIVAAAIPLIAAVGLYLQTGSVNAPEVSLVITGLISAVLVAVLRNSEAGLQAFAKFFAAALTPIVSAILQAVVSGAFDRAEVITLLVGLLTSVMVYLTANRTSSSG